MKRQGRLGVGIVGCGTISGVHADAVQSLECAELVSVFDENGGKAEELGEKTGVPAYSRWESFIADDRLDLVSICTPNGTHLDLGQKAAEAGKHVVVEKPIEVTLLRGRALIDACNRCGVRLAVIFQNRFLTGALNMKEAIRQGELGNVFLADATVKWFRNQAYYDSAAWRGTLVLDGGGVLINQAIHTVDLLQWMVGRVKTVFGHTGTFTHPHMEGEDTAVASLRFENGAVGVIEASTSIQPAMDRQVVIHGEKGTAVLDGDAFRLVKTGDSTVETESGRKPKSGGAASPLQNFSVEPHRKQFEAIVQALLQDNIPPVSGEESLQALAIVRSIYESARTALPVEVQKMPGVCT